MEIILETMGFFSVEEKDKTIDISVATSDGNLVTLEIRKKYPYNKHLKELTNNLNKLEDDFNK